MAQCIWGQWFQFGTGYSPLPSEIQSPLSIALSPLFTPSVWHKLTTYEYIVQHRLPQEAKETHRELKLCPPKMRPIQV